MSPEAMRVAIAEARGWRRSLIWPDRWLEPGETMDPPLRWHQTVPDYPNDLNAMHEAEKSLIFSKRKAFKFELQKVASRGLPPDTTIHMHELIHATAAQRAEAFLRVLGKCHSADQGRQEAR